jgi:hypothetical protein
MLRVDPAESEHPDLEGSWPDSDDPLLRWALPAGLELRADEDGTPRFLLSRWRDPVADAAGGMLHLDLAAAGPDEGLAVAAAAAGRELRSAPFVAVRFRLQLRAVGVDQVRALGDWRSAPPAADPLVAITDALDADTAQLLTAALADAGAALEVAVEAVAAGVAGRLPALVVVDAARLHPLLEAALAELDADPDQPGVPAEAVVVALRSLPDDQTLVRIEPLDGQPPPDRSRVLAELAHRLLEDLFVVAGGIDPSPWSVRRYQLVDRPPLRPLAFDLRTWRPARLRWAARWSVSTWLAGLDPGQRARLLPRLDGVAVLGTAPVVVVCAVPIDTEGGVRRVQVDVTATGAGGLPDRRSFSFTGGTSVARFTAVFPALTDDLALSAQAAATLAPVPGAVPAWPRVLAQRPVAPDGTLVTVTPATVGVATLPVGADPAVFATAARLDLAVRAGERTVAGTTLRAGRAGAVLAFPAADEPLVLDTTAVRAGDPGGPPLPLPVRAVPPNQEGLTIQATDLEDLDPAEVLVELDDPDRRTAYAAVALLDRTARGRTFTLDPGTPVTWLCHRPTVLDPLSYQWQLHYVARRPDGTTAPLRSTAWAEATTTRLTIPAPDAG